MGKGLWWSLFLVLAPTGEPREAEMGGEMCRAWFYGSAASSSPFAAATSDVGPFQCPAELDGADARFCCGTCSSPYCCSAEGARLDQERCLASQELETTTKGQAKGDAQTEGHAPVRKAAGVTDQTPGGGTAQAEWTTQVEWTTQAEGTTDPQGTTNPPPKGKAESVKIIVVLIGLGAFLFIGWLSCHLWVKWNRNLRLAEQEALRHPPDGIPPVTTSVINMPPLPLPPPPPYDGPEDAPPPYSLVDPQRPSAQPPASESAPVVLFGCQNPAYQEGEEVIDMSSEVFVDGESHGAVAQPANEEQALTLPEPTVEGQASALLGLSDEGQVSPLPEPVGEGQVSPLLEPVGEGQVSPLPEPVGEGQVLSSLKAAVQREDCVVLEFSEKEESVASLECI